MVSSAPPYSGIPDPQSILPYLGIYTLVALNPEKLQHTDFHVFMEPDASELCDGHWTTIALPHVTCSQITAQIHDATSLHHTDHNKGCDIELAGMPDNEQRYWRLPTEITPILTYLLYSVANLTESNVKEIQLAIELHGLLTIHCIKNKGSSHSPHVRGGNPDVGSKRGRDQSPGSSGAPKRARQSLLKRGTRGSVQAGELLLSILIVISLV